MIWRLWLSFLFLFTLACFEVEEDGLIHVIILHTNDDHGNLSPGEAFWLNPDFPPPLGNARAIGTLVKEFRKFAEERGYIFLYFDAADYFQGTPLGEYTNGKAVMDFLNYVGARAGAIGNHDFDFGRDIPFDSLPRWAQFPLLVANLVDSTGNPPPPLRSYIVFEEKGIRFGVFGLVTHWLAGMTSPENLRGLRVLNEIETARKMVSILREKEEVDIVIAVTHVGFRHDRRIAAQVPGIDLIIGGHSHTGIEPPYEDPVNHTIIVQAYSHMADLGFVELKIDPETRRIVGYRGKIFDLLREKVPDDPSVDSLLRPFEEEVSRVFDQVIGEATADFFRAGFEESSMGNLVTDALRWKFGADIAIYNAGGIRGNFRAGPVTLRDVFHAFPYPNTAVIARYKGSDLLHVLAVGYNRHHANFQVSGIQIYYREGVWDTVEIQVAALDSATYERIGKEVVKVPIARIERALINGRPLDPDSIYTVVTNSFLASGASEYIVFLTAQDMRDTGIRIAQVVAEYIQHKGKISPRVEGRLVRLEDDCDVL